LNKYLYIVILIVAFASCKKKSAPAPVIDVGTDYYPTAIGKYVIYEADSTVYDEFTHLPTNYKYQIKEKIEEQFTDNEGKPALRLMRYIKKYDPNVAYSAMPWTIKSAWMVNVSATDVEVVEENIRFTKLIFPVKEGSTWDGNAKNTIGEWTYTYLGIDAPQTINSVYFDKALTVKQKDYRTLISYQYYIEKYARGTGLVYREITDLYSGTVVTGVPVENRIEKGTIYRLTVISYGNE
jgi:hypothetical protein